MFATRLAIALLATLALAACATTPPEEDPVQIRLNDLDARLARIERVMSNQSLVGLAQRIDSLQADVRSLRGQVEELQNGNEGVRRQQRELYADLDKRLAALEGSPRAPLAAGSGAGAGAAAAAAAATSGAMTGGAMAPAAAGSPATTTESAAYGQAFDALKNGNYPAAITAFKGFLAAYPASELTSNAQYWLGEAYYVTRDFEAAASAFQRVVREWPSSRKAPDALVKLGFTQVELKHYPAARATLSQVLTQYPGTDAAKLADERLHKLPAP